MESYKDVKIGVYAICSGEPNEFIDRWLTSMSKADYIWVLITKLNDPNYAYFKEKQKLDEFKDKLFVTEKEIKPWRFDVARNESMALVDKPCDALICTDIDEVLIEDFWDDYRKVVFEHPNFERVYYQFAWKHDSESGEPTTIFGMTKHSTKTATSGILRYTRRCLVKLINTVITGNTSLTKRKSTCITIPTKIKQEVGTSTF